MFNVQNCDVILKYYRHKPIDLTNAHVLGWGKWRLRGLYLKLPGCVRGNCSEPLLERNKGRCVYVPKISSRWHPWTLWNLNFFGLEWRNGVGVGGILCAFRTSAKPAFFSAVTHKVKMPTMKTSYMFLQVISKTVPSLSLNPLPCWLFLFFTRSGHCCREQLHSTNTNTFSCPNPQNKDLFSSTPCSTNYFTRLQLWKYLTLMSHGMQRRPILAKSDFPDA
jgi:hypothetical protein